MDYLLPSTYFVLYTHRGSDYLHVMHGYCHEDALFLFQMNTADATTHVAAPSARYKFMLSYPPSSSFFGNAVDGWVAHSASYTWSASETSRGHMHAS